MGMKIVTLVAVIIGSVLLGAPTGMAHAAEYTSAANNLRDGWDANEPALSPAAVAGQGFGRLFSAKVNGQVYAQPLVVGNTVIVATENDWVYGINATSGTVNWSTQLGAPWPSAAVHCPDVQPNFGVTSTPVYDPSTNKVYLVAETVPPGNTASDPVFTLFAMNPGTGAITKRIGIGGMPTNGGVALHPFDSLQRAGLLLLNGTVYVGFTGHCDFTPYTGYVAGINVAAGQVRLWSTGSSVTDNRSGIWAAGTGLMSDGSGRIFFATGNGEYPPQVAGTASPAPRDLGESLVRLGVNGDGSLSARDFFSPATAPALSAADLDLGSGGPVALPFGTTAYPKLLAEAGKEGVIYLLNRDNLGGRGQGAGGTDKVVAKKGRYGGEYGRPAAFGATTAIPGNTSATNDYLYYVGDTDFLRILRVGASANGVPTLSDVANTSVKFGYLSAGSPVVTSNGKNPASAVLWVVGMDNETGSNGKLYAFRAVPAPGCTQQAQCRIQPIRTLPIGTATKFSVPATSDGRVYVGTKDGHLLAFGTPCTAPVRAAGTAFGGVTVGHSVVQTLTLTAANTTTVTQISTQAATGGSFRILAVRDRNGAAVGFPASIATGRSLQVQVRFTPASPGPVTGAMVVATRTANFPAVQLGLSGTGIQAGFYATPSAVNFGQVAAGLHGYATVRIVNGGATAETVTSRQAPSGPFAVTGWPNSGATIGAGKSIALKITYSPSGPAPAVTSLSIGGPAGTRATVSLSGTGLTARSALSSSARPVAFGPVALGQQAKQTITITNTGNLPATIGSVTAPRAPFGAPSPALTGMHLNPGDLVHIPLTFTPASAGNAGSSIAIGWSDVQGKHSLTIPITGTGQAAAAGTVAVPPPGGGWTLNGSASVAGTSLQLTPAGSQLAGSAVYPVPEPANDVSASFTTDFSGGTGGDGLTFSLLDAASATDRSLGTPGQLLGYGGLSGVAVTLDTVGGQSHVGIATGENGGALVNQVYTAQNVPDLRTGTHVTQVSVSYGQIAVSIDGVQVIAPTTVTLPSQVLLAFTAGTGTSAETDVHAVTDATITAGGAPVPPPGGGWSFNGYARMSSADTVLTTRSPADQAGTVIYPTPVKTAGLNVTFEAQLSGTGSYGDYGLTFALLNPALFDDTYVGDFGPSLGFGSAALDGTSTAVTLVTGDPTGEAPQYTGISTGLTGSVLSYWNQAYGIPELRTGSHLVNVRLTPATGGLLFTVTLDGVPVIHQVMANGIPATALLAFTAGTATQPDTQLVRNVSISAQS
jgi:hypothetical protein